MAHVRDDKIAGVPVQINVSTSGRFTVQEILGGTGEPGDGIEVGDTLGSGETLDQAKDDARRELAKKKVKVEVPFLTMRGERGVATSRRAGSRNKIQARIGNRAEQLDSYRSVLRADMPQEEFDRMRSLLEQASKLTREAEDLRKQYEFRLDRAVDEAVEKAVEAKAAGA